MGKNQNSILFLLLLFSICNYSQNQFTVSGTITEMSSNETMIGATLVVPALGTGTTTNEYGFYSLTLPKGIYEIQVSSLGYEDVIVQVNLSTADQQLHFQLVEAAQQLQEVVVTDNIEGLNVRKPQMSVNTLAIETIKKIPVVLGEADIIKSILLLPGVSNAGEGASGFNVRGGAVDQNLILLDEATIFNSSHLFGFFSVFNPDAIKDMKLYKGGIPARFGGRVSSVLDIFQKEGNSKAVKIQGGIGAVASRLLVEGPIIKDRAAFLIGGRGSYAHLFLPLVDMDNSAYFYDLNTKLNYRINARNNIFLSGYFGRDVFRISDSFANTYGNSVLNFRWNHLFSDRIFANLSLIYSDYHYGLELDFVGFKWDSGIENFNFKYDLKYYINNNFQINSGINTTYYRFNPGKIRPNRASSGILERQMTQKYANELALYVDVEQDIAPQLQAQYGLRLSTFARLGQEEFPVYSDNAPILFDDFLGIYKKAAPIATLHPKRGDRLATYTHLEPRMALAYTLNADNSIKASYTRLAQYLHLLSNTSSPTPLDVWAPSGPFIKPQLLDQYALGYFRTLQQQRYSWETEVFYKKIQNRIDYIDGADLIANNAIEQVILSGEARAFGLEVLFKKNKGDLQGWLAYTLSKSEQRTPGKAAGETGINNGEWYNTPYDKTHDISLYASYESSDTWSFNSNFILQTGQPTNYPIGQFEFQNMTIPYYGPRNRERLPAYHRVDVSATLTPKKNENRKFRSEWVFSIYNLYNRKNAASIGFSRNSETGVNEAVRTSIFGIVPAVTYNFKF